MTPLFRSVGVAGAGAMGRGIAQICAQAGSTVKLYDTQPEALARSRDEVFGQWDRMRDKGRMDAAAADACKQRLQIVNDLASLADCDLVIEAIVERLDAKQSLFAQLEALVQPTTVLATNTSSLSVTAIAAGLQRPRARGRLPLLQPSAADESGGSGGGPEERRRRLRRADAVRPELGHTPVQAKDTPGFIVNHAGRGYGTEALRIVSEGVADFATVDRILRDQVGFRMGPFELLDLTALDVSHPAMESIYRQYYEEPRYRPSPITAQRLAGGVVGRKSGEGFYRYVDGKAQVPAEPPAPSVAEVPPVWVSTRAARRSELYQLLKDLGAKIETGQSPSLHALSLVAPLGFDITTVAVVERLDPARTVGIDMLIEDSATKRRVLATNPATRTDMRDAAHALFARDGKAVSVIRDSGGFVSQRVIASIVNIASDICQQRICSPARSGDRRDARPGLSARAARDGRPLGPGQRAGSAVQHADGVWRSALPSQPLAAAARRHRPVPAPRGTLTTTRTRRPQAVLVILRHDR